MNRQQIIAIILVGLMVGSSVVYGLAFAFF
ncbi:hypothetical protein BDK61_0259 [Haloarcula quadrata]|jgi:hypothetical protein|uniref:Uncharacterized protein n=1 Tax=Haloarcula quadrata TaxID=182779 RepID=A0A495R1D2_9EURY|nr:hypothetical protein BDK61_0259 [Haloarcula quadrata]